MLGGSAKKLTDYLTTRLPLCFLLPFKHGLRVIK